MYKNIAITSAGRRVALYRIFEKGLRQFDPDSKVIALDENPSFSATCQIATKTVTVPSVSSSDHLTNLAKVCRENEIGLLIPTRDYELPVYAEVAGEFLKNGTHIMVSGKQFIDICKNKESTHQFFVDRGIPTPKLQAKESPQFPLFVKPFNGNGGNDTFVVLNEEELRKEWVEDPRFLFFDYIDPGNYKEFSIDIYYSRDGELCCGVPRERLQTRTGEVMKSITVRHPVFNEVIQKLSLERGASGIINLQVFVSNDFTQIFGIEINPRCGGGFPLTEEAGGTFVQWLIQEVFLGKKIVFSDEWQSGVCMLRFDDHVITTTSG